MVVVNVRLDGDTVTSVLFELMSTITLPVGSVFSTTVYVPVPPSPTVSDVGATVTPGVSSSVTVTATSGHAAVWSPSRVSTARLSLCVVVVVVRSVESFSSAAETVVPSGP